MDVPENSLREGAGGISIDCEEDQTLRPVLVGMLREDDKKRHKKT